MREPGFYFQTEKKNTYFYNDVTGVVTLCSNPQKEDFIFYNIEKEEFKYEINPEDIEKVIQATGFKQLTLIVTENCNLRCKYCAFSGEYTNNRIHNTATMDYDTAQKAVDFYFNGFKKVQINNPALNPIVGFYGGEPTLNFDLMRKIVLYIDNIYNGKVVYTVTTNAAYLTDEMLDYFIENDFLLSVSLNGDKDEHDRLRVYPNGKGTYDDIYKNMKRLREKNQVYFETKVTLITCFDWNTDMIKLKEAGMKKEPNLPRTGRLLQIADCFSDWYQRIKDVQRDKFVEDKNKLFHEFMENMKNKGKVDDVSRLLFSQDCFDVLNRKVNINTKELKGPLIPYTGTCLPGTKVCVSPNGELHCCEKINMSRKIGNIDEGFDYGKICEMMYDYLKIMYPICSTCPTQRLCPICFITCLNEDGQFTRSELKNCENLRKDIRRKFSQVYTLLEDGILQDELLNI